VRDIVKKEILLFGPVTLGFEAQEEFNFYHSGIYHPFPLENITQRWIYGHEVRVIGWGYDSGLVNEMGLADGNYWLAVNSFGEQWGDGGTFRLSSALYEEPNKYNFTSHMYGFRAGVA